MAAPAFKWTWFPLETSIRLLVILLLAFLANRVLKMMTNWLVKPASAATRIAEMREQQKRTLAGVLYSGGTVLILGLALLTALPEFGFSVTPIAALGGLARRSPGVRRAKPDSGCDQRVLNRLRGPVRGGREDTCRRGAGMRRALYAAAHGIAQRKRQPGHASQRRNPPGGQSEPRLVATLRRRAGGCGRAGGRGPGGAREGRERNARRHEVVGGAGGGTSGARRRGADAFRRNASGTGPHTARSPG